MFRAILMLLVAALPLRAADRPDVLVVDFEGDTYAPGWTTTGTAFGTGPAKGTLPNQMPVSGFLGKGLVNSYLGGDAGVGTLTSPEFKVERRFLNFLIGGGKSAKTCMNLLVNGKVVRTATGPNDKPGGSEHLDWHSWDVAEFEGKLAVLQIIDDERGGWGHINVDHITQSDAKKQAQPFVRAIKGETRYLHLPVKNGAPMRRMRFVVDKETVREFDIELADGAEPDFWVFADIAAFKGKGIEIHCVCVNAKTLDALRLSNDLPEAETLYREKHRPLFHFTSRRGWLNDPNGLVFADNEWHLFYQHNPFGTKWGNMHWGHAVSPDLVHWNELGDALYPRQYGDFAFSGSAVVDKGNTSGWGTKEKPPLVLAYTSTGRGECIAYSNDRGRTWTEYDKNPVVKHAGRDPKLVWYEPGKHWVMAVYDEFEKKQWIAFYTSPDLKTWTFTSRIEGFYECPDLFELAIQDPLWGPTGKARWVLYGADGKYLTGHFNGKEFTPDSPKKKQLWYGRFYAAQTFDSAPVKLHRGDKKKPYSRRIQIGWAQSVTFPGMPYNQQMTVPVELKLTTVEREGGPVLEALPVEELATLRDEKPAFELAGERALSDRTVLAENLDAFEAELLLEFPKGAGFSIDLRGTNITYDAEKKALTCKDVTVPLPYSEIETLFLTVLVDRGSVEVFVNGVVAMSVAAIPDERNYTLAITPTGGKVTLNAQSKVHRMKSAWGK